MAGRLKRHRGLDPVSIQGLVAWDPPVSSYQNQETRDGSVYVAVFQIDWRYSKKSIVDSFSHWVDENEPEGISKFEARGRNAPLAQHKEDLEALGIYRIIQHHTLPITEIIPIYQDDLAARFASESAWSKAKKRAQNAMDAITFR